MFHCDCRVLLLSAMTVVALAGCGERRRMPIEGAVTLDNRPLEKGAIVFRPLAGTPGPTAGATIADGKFAILPSGGPFAGDFVVEITAAGRTGRKAINIRTDRLEDEYTQILPARYNSRSELQVEVKDNALNRFEFALTSQ